MPVYMPPPLVDRLRAVGIPLTIEAADEIERLQELARKTPGRRDFQNDNPRPPMKAGSTPSK